MVDDVAYYGTLSYRKQDNPKSYRKNHWLIKGHQPSLMASRVIPDSWADGVGERCVPDNTSANEHLQWIMMRYPLHIIDQELWDDGL